MAGRAVGAGDAAAIRPDTRQALELSRGNQLVGEREEDHLLFLEVVSRLLDHRRQRPAGLRLGFRGAQRHQFVVDLVVLGAHRRRGTAGRHDPFDGSEQQLVFHPCV